jgi:hypothetical protein
MGSKLKTKICLNTTKSPYNTPFRHVIFFQKAAVLKCDIYIYRTQKEKNCKDPSNLTYFFLTLKNRRSPLGLKKNNRILGLLHSNEATATKQTIN